MSVGKRSNEDAPSWQGGETGSAIGDSVSASNDGVNPKDMTEILDSGFGENHLPPMNNRNKVVASPNCDGKQSWMKRLLLAIRKCFSCEKLPLVSIATVVCTMQLQAYQTETVNGITWKFTHPSSTTSSIYGYMADNGSGYETAIPTGTTGNIVIPSTLGGCPVTRIANYAFYFCNKITSIVIPDTVTYVGKFALQGCDKLERIVVGRSVSSVGRYAFSTKLNYSSSSSLKTIVIMGGRITGEQDYYITDRSSGVSVYVSSRWSLPSTWEGYSVKYYDPIPEIGSAVAKNLTEALCYATDDKLKTKLDNESKYNAFRVWANGVCGTSDMTKRQAVMDSSLGWFSYVIDADSLLTKAPVQGDMSIDRFVPNAEQVKTFDLDISIADISVGDGATATNLAEVFSIEGATAPNGEYSSDSVVSSFSVMSNGKVRCVAAPKDSSATSFFMRVRMNP